jgi:transposase-like protein
MVDLGGSMASGRLAELELSAAERGQLRSLAARRNTAQALALRAGIVLACAEGSQNKAVAARLQIDPATVGKWRRRFVAQRLDGLRDEPRSGAPRTIADARIEEVIVRTLESLPPGATHWSSRGMARQSGLSVSTVQRCAPQSQPGATLRPSRAHSRRWPPSPGRDRVLAQPRDHG